MYFLSQNMRVIQFSFKFSPVGHGKTLTLALLHHAFPRKHHLLFPYDFRYILLNSHLLKLFQISYYVCFDILKNSLYSEPYYNCQRAVSTFRDSTDWGKELSRTGAVGWKLSAVNQDFQLSIRYLYQ